MKQYLLSIYQPDDVVPPPEVLTKVMKDVASLIGDMKQAGAWVFNGGLHPASSATVVRVSGEELLTTDGPYTEGKEHIGGFIVIRAADLDAALHWARKTAGAIRGLPIEVRPFQGDGGSART
jgi:hypothetical protein